MNKYFLVAKNTWEEVFTYRLNFVMFRIRVVLQLLTAYFLWFALIPKEGQLFGYSQQLMLTYILGTSVLGAVVIATRTHEIGENISKGDLSIFLIRPINYFLYWLAKDFGDKAMNIFFSILEISIILFIFHPPIFIQTNLFFLFFAFTATLVAVFLNFLIGAMLGLIGFWSPEVWAPRFIFYVLITFIAGGVFPLDILPNSIFSFFQLLPFTYLLYFPIKIYLGQLSFGQITYGIVVALAWVGILMLMLQAIWMKGLRAYGAEGR